MKLSKQQLADMLRDTEGNTLSEEEVSNAIEELESNTLEIEGYCKIDDHEKDLIYALRNVKIKGIKANEPEGWTYLIEDRRVVRTEISIKIEASNESDCELVLSSLEEIKFQQKNKQ